jgi:type II secretory ATPase GspE/PulE/Tfp pilus assembly ATPase PilB-like protein
VLVTGPTHSGKSIVCYSAVMRRLLHGDSVTTIEAPRKFRLPGARQIQLGYGGNYENFYANALADDPRVLLVQEIRYYEPIVGALASARERLVVAGIHAGEVILCLIRLQRFAGDEKFPQSEQKRIRQDRELLAESLSLVCSGRVLNLLCPGCRQPGTVPAATIRRSGLAVAGEGDVPVFSPGPGCEACRGTGIAGCRGIYEVLPISRDMRRLLAGPVPECAIIRQAREEGLLSLREMALRLALDGAIGFQHAIAATSPPFPDDLNH